MEYLSSSFSNNGCSGLSADYFGSRECKCHGQSWQDAEKAIHNKQQGCRMVKFKHFFSSSTVHAALNTTESSPFPYFLQPLINPFFNPSTP